MRLAPGFTLGGLLHCALGSAADAAVPPAAAAREEIDAFWMGAALQEAMAANGRASPNPAVGCVVVKDGICLARGATEAYGGRHAERVALDSLPLDAARGATLYCTLEPCSHYGRQPPCVDRVLAAGVARCVIAILDPNPLVNHQGIRKLQQHGIEVRIGVRGAEAAAWHLPFLNWHRSGRPLVAAKWAQTLDGQLAYDCGEPRWLSNAASRRYAHWLRQRYDAILIGAGTALADIPSLTVRDCPLPDTRHPHRVLFDPNGRLLRCEDALWRALQERLFSADAMTMVVCGEAALDTAAADRLGWLERQHHTAVLPLPADEPESLAWTMNYLAESLSARFPIAPIQSVMLEGGPQLLSQCFAHSLVDAAHVFIAPFLGGGNRHRLQLPTPLINGLNFQLVASHAIGDDLLAEYFHGNLIDALVSWHRQVDGAELSW